jgi:dihydrofolate synthase/folylpolyglutamate synthase
MNYSDSLVWLDSLTLHGIKLGLEKTRALAAHLGNPERAHPCVLIGGTNGKGSTLAFLASLCMAAGKKVGQYTSPHLISPRERIVINDAAVSEADFAAALDAVRAAADRAGIVPTYFEALTLAAFRHFSGRPLDLVLLEVGLGGRLDATNIAEPLLSVITTIDYDHMEHLGPTLTDIAREKAGIMRGGVPVLSGARPPEAADALRAAAAKAGARLESLDAFARWGKSADGDLMFNINGAAYPPLRLSLAGEHQIRNAALALRAAQHLAARSLAGPPDTAASALPLARWQGRLQPFFNGRLWLDGAHNPEGACGAAGFRGNPAPPAPAAVRLHARQGHPRTRRRALPRLRRDLAAADRVRPRRVPRADPRRAARAAGACERTKYPWGAPLNARDFDSPRRGAARAGRAGGFPGRAGPRHGDRRLALPRGGMSGTAAALTDGPRRPLNLLRMRSLGKYQLVSEIGQGGMGVVWDGFDTTLERAVAIKCLTLQGLSEAKRLSARSASCARRAPPPGCSTPTSSPSTTSASTTASPTW